MMRVYDWCFFFENGTKNYLYLPFGPEATEDNKHNNLVHDLDGEWMQKVFEVYPYAEEYIREPNRSFAWAIVNPPQEESEIKDFVWSPEVMDWLEKNDRQGT